MYRISIALCLIVILAASTGCDPKVPPDASVGAKFRVVTTIGMITDIVKNVGGNRVEVIGLMGPGVDPHLYKASAGDVQKLNAASLIFYNGLHLESKVGDVLAKMSADIKTIAVTDAVDRNLLLTPPEYEGQYDPHLWFDVTLWMKAVVKVRNVLSEFDPDSTVTYWSNAERYLAKLTELHAYVKSQVERVPPQQRVLVTAHDAFNYFGKGYGFEVRGLQGISTATEAGIADVQELATFIAERRIPAIFVESSVSSKSLEAVKAAVKSKGFDVEIGGELFSDAMGNAGTPEGTYIGMVRHNIDTIVKALIKESGEDTPPTKESGLQPPPTGEN
ncbi:manganese transporter [Candidatus Poribacteria bacterium]|nr:manganese transporter [Candidatus Poribacteria bacterium]MYG07327.1 manganese transporter [Candidatus Poribacteria bacterium]MYK23988.1 manganese transporter [Candidatus Poribacteria bacterium]